MPSDDRSPLERSQAGGFNFLSALLGFLAVVTLVGTILIWTIDEQENALERGALMLGITVFVGGLSGLLAWLGRRPPPRPPQPSHGAGVPYGRWRRRRLGPAWTDWASFGIPPVLIGIPLLFLMPKLDVDGVVGALVVVGMIDLLIIPQFIVSRRERVELELHPEGLMITLRNGSQRLLRRGEIRAIRLSVGRVRGFAFGTLELHPADGPPIVFREPMDASLPEIAHHAAMHVGLPVQSA